MELWPESRSGDGTLALLAGVDPALGALCGAVLGAVVGSFIGAALVRLPQGRSVIAGRSACDHCARVLGWRELVPVLSFVVQRGRCRTCAGAIGGWQIGAELGGAAIGAGAVLVASPGTTLAAMLFGWQLLLLALLDARHFWLPRGLNGLLAGTGLLLALARQGADPMALPLALAGGALGFGLLWLVAFAYRRWSGRDGIGGGDPLLLGAIGLWLGPQGVMTSLLGASVLGLVLAIAIAVTGRRIAPDTALPLGSLLAATAWPVFCVSGFA